MAQKTKIKGRKELIAGVAVLSVILVVLLVVAFGLFKGVPAEFAAMGILPQETQAGPEENPYGPEDFRFEGQAAQLVSGGGTLGIDVSDHQGDIDWQQVAEAGVDFAMIRIGYRGYGKGTGNIVADSHARANYQGAKENGIRVGVYFFSQAISPVEVMEEARFVLDAIRDWEIDMAVVYDWEYVKDTARTAHINAHQLTAYSRIFCTVMKEKGYDTMVYFNRHQAARRLKLGELEEFPFWLAMYQQEMNYPYKVEMWQYTDSGKIPGIEGNVDLNILLPGWKEK